MRTLHRSRRAALTAILLASVAGGAAAAEPPPPAPAAAAALANPAPGSGRFLGANFWNINWQGPQDYFRAGVDFAAAGNPWRADLLADLAPYRVLRFMDWNDTNAAQTIQAHFGTRKAKAAAQDQPVAYEWQIDLCNRANKDCWVNLHHLSNADDWRQVAGLFRSGLKPTLRLYVEWSNEVWNGSFPQHAHAVAEAKRLGLPGDNGAAAYSVHASVRMFEEFSKVFAGQGQRLVRVLAGQVAWTGPCEAQLAALGDPRINPAGTRPDVYAVAPYISGKSPAELRGGIPEAAKLVAGHASCVQKMHVPLIAYEGGSDSFSMGNGCIGLQQDPGMRSLYPDYLDALFDAGLKGPFMQYTHTGGCWGLKVRSGDSPEKSPKYRGVLDWVARQPAR
jgi:hypothetical protein